MNLVLYINKNDLVTDVYWETQCAHIEVTLHQYVAWLEGDAGADNPLVDVDRTLYSCYIDYKYMKDIFQDHEDLLKVIFELMVINESFH